MGAIFAWLGSFIVSSFLVKFFAGLIFVGVSSGLILTVMNHITTYLSQFSMINILLLAGVGDAVSIIGSAFLFKSGFLYLAKRLSS